MWRLGRDLKQSLDVDARPLRLGRIGEKSRAWWGSGTLSVHSQRRAPGGTLDAAVDELATLLCTVAGSLSKLPSRLACEIVAVVLLRLVGGWNLETYRPEELAESGQLAGKRGRGAPVIVRTGEMAGCGQLGGTRGLSR